MIRAETATDWILVTHPDHAALAGQIADAWGNADFSAPSPYEAIRYAVYHHDDGWLARDAEPNLTPVGKPEAFTRDLVGAYSAFEEIDLPAYLRVRAHATAAVAAVNRAAAVIVSMHTVNLLTEQADMSSIRPEHRDAHADFLTSQRDWQQATAADLGLDGDHLQRGFEFLQCCDNLSLIVCSGYDRARDLRHRHPDCRGTRHTLVSTPAGANAWRISPWPFANDNVELTLPFRRIPKSAVSDLASYRHAFAAADRQKLTVTLQR